MEYPPEFKCSICNKKYDRDKCYKKHKLICEILREKRETNVDDQYKNLGIHNLALIVVELVKSNDKLQKDVMELKNWVQVKKQKFIVIDWLNENYKLKQNFESFLSNIIITQVDLEIIFNSNFISGINGILQNFIQKNKDLDLEIPFKSFDQKDNTIYVFKEKWKILSKEDLDDIFSLISKGILKEFKSWQDKNEARLYTDEFSVIYINNVKKIMGGRETLEKQKKIIHRNLYKYLKMNVENIIQYEFS